MSLTSKSTLSLKKKDVQQQKKAGTAYRRLVFAHKAAAGETGINFTSLVQPSEMAALGFTNPTSGDILAANVLFYKKNLTVISSARGVLMQDLSYTIPTSSRIEFQGFTSLDGEIFTCLLETGVKDGLNVVDASPIIATGELAIGVTDFNVGTPFEVNKYNAQQVGAVLVFRNGMIQFRNPSNGTSGGNYQEVNNGSGLATVIRFNTAPSGQADNIVVWGNMMAERPEGSMTAAIESLAGQLDQMIPTLAALAGVPETTFQAQPNNQDLKAFGDSVIDHENRIDKLEVPMTVQKFTSGSGTYTTPANVRWIKVRMVGGGAGGKGSGAGGTTGAGGAGGNSTFGTSLLTANGAAGNGGDIGGVGGTATANSPSVPLSALTGGSGGGISINVTFGYVSGGMGAASPFGGAGGGGGGNSAGQSAIANSGSGGGGASTGPNNGSYSGAGGGAGGFIEALIYTPSATYAYSVGTGGTAGTAGTGGYAGGTGGSGVIIVEEYY